MTEPRTGSVLFVICGLLAALAGAHVAQAHTITVDGDLSDWCFATLAPGAPDTRALLEPPTCAAGTEVVWYDGAGDNLDVNDLGNVGTTADATNLYFGGHTLNAVVTSSIPHIQLAIDVAPGGNTAWLDPDQELNHPGVGVASIPILQPDYLVVFDFFAATVGIDGARLYEATSAAGVWTFVDDFQVGINTVTAELEVAIPWTAFACAGCPGLGPDDSFRFTFMLAKGILGVTDNFKPLGPIQDLPSEAVAGTYTSTAVSCDPTLIAGTSTECELADNSADAFLLVGDAGPEPCVDGDQDGYGSPGSSECPQGGQEDCDDADSDVFPGAVEACDGIDNNCDGSADEDTFVELPGGARGFHRCEGFERDETPRSVRRPGAERPTTRRDEALRSRR